MNPDPAELLREAAAELGIGWSGPPPRRVGCVTGEDRISALAWGDDPEIVLLHGMGLNAHTFDGTAMALDRPLIALDLPGHGESSWRSEPRYGPEEVARSVLEAVDALAPGARLLVGHSLGGLTALAVAALRPGRVASAVLVDVTPAIAADDGASVRSFLSGPESFASREEIVERARAFGIGRSRAQVERGVFHNTRIRGDGRVVWKHHLGNLRALPEPSGDPSRLWEPLARLGSATTLVRASRGFVTDRQMAELARRAPQTKVELVDSGHNVQEDDPVRLAELIDAAAALD